LFLFLKQLLNGVVFVSDRVALGESPETVGLLLNRVLNEKTDYFFLTSRGCDVVGCTEVVVGGIEVGSTVQFFL
jgi:hypothetical protein